MDNNLNAMEKPLLSDGSHLPQQIRKRGNSISGKYRRCRSAPAKDNCALNGSCLSPPNQDFDFSSPSFRQVALILLMYLGLGTLCFSVIRNQLSGLVTESFVDGLYFVVATMTTVGYGDLVPATVTAKLLACAFVFSGMALVGLVLSKAADYIVEKQEKMFMKALHKDHQHGADEIVEDKKYKLYITGGALVLLIVMGTLVLYVGEHLSLLNAFYCVCATITTLGYGDQSFSTMGGRIFAVFWILSSTICLAQFFLYLAELSTDRRQSQLTKWVLSRKLTSYDLEAADLDDDGSISAAEFIVYKLKEMRKISDDDVALIMAEFRHLDADQSGTLSASDLTLSQSP